MSETLVWWLVLQTVGLACLPLCLTLFRRLPDRGYALSKPFALIIVGYLFWVLVIIGLPNVTVTIAWVVVLLAACSAYLAWRRRDELLTFVRAHVWLIVSTEVLFFLAFITAAYLRSFVPDLTGTEKPMDFMFLNAVTRGESFPPADPWLAGENVSYYYFGYLIISIVTRLAGLGTEVGFNLGLSMIVALAATGAFGLVYNLAAAREERSAAPAQPGRRASRAKAPAPPAASGTLWRPIVFGVVAALLLTVMGNAEGLLEWMASRGIGTAGFWSWLNVNGGELTGYSSERWYPDNFWFWWRATRVIEVVPGIDGGLGTHGIHEFPFFSFLLGDMHPHVMAIPFVLLAVGLALALIRSDEPLDVVFWLERPLALVAAGIIVGGLSFLNTWDMPTMALLVVLAALLRNRLHAERWSWGLALDTLGFALPLFVLAFLAYTPFFFGGFESQAAGFTADWRHGTRPFHALLLWGPFAALVLPYAVWRLARSGAGITWRAALWALAPVLLIVLLWVSWDALAAALDWLPKSLRPNEAEQGLGTRIADRGTGWYTALLAGAALWLLVLALAREVERTRRDDDGRLGHVFALTIAAVGTLLILGSEFFFIQDGFNSRMNTIFKLYYQAWLLLSIAGGFALYELVRDWRFPKLRLPQAVTFDASVGNWGPGELAVTTATAFGAITGVVMMRETLTTLALLSGLIGGALFLAASATLVLFSRDLARRQGQKIAGGPLGWRVPWAAIAAATLAAAFVYPVLATWSRTEGCVAHPVRLLEEENCGNIFSARSLDGLSRMNPDERAAIEFLADQDGQPVIAEALGQSYTEGGRISAATGLITPLEWPGHESQWRGNADAQAGRPEDIELLYTSDNPEMVKSVLEKYGITYVVLGNIERQQYQGIHLPELGDLFEPAFEQGEVTVYKVRPNVLAEAAPNAP